MNPESELLKEKALLLLSREREIVDLRKRHARVTGWLAVAQNLPELVTREAASSILFAELAKKLVALLELQRVLFFSVTPGGELLPLVRQRKPGPRALTPTVERLLSEQPVGLCNHADSDALRDLAEILGLHRFMWQRLGQLGSRPPLLIAAGYDAEKALFYEPFADDDFIHFKNMGQHLSALLHNIDLVKELGDEKRALQKFNETLEERVRERTEQLGKANGELALTVRSLEEKDRHLRDDLEQARSFQRSILAAVPRSARVDFAATYRPLELVGGDVYDISEIDVGHFRCFMADATGHGVQASLRTIVLKSEYDRVKGTIAAPNVLLEELNRRLTEGYGSEEMLCTACCFDLILTDSGATVRYANCAQPPLCRVRGPSIDEIYSAGPFVGLLSEIDVSMVEASLARGDVLLAYSDGICEQVDASGAVFALPSTLAAAAGGGVDAERLLGNIVEELDAFRGQAPLSDDITMLVARIL